MIKIGELVEGHLAITFSWPNERGFSTAVRREIAQLLHTRVTRSSRIAIAHTPSAGELLQSRMKHSAPETMFKALMKVANFPKLIFDPTVFNPGLKSSEGCGRKIIFL